MFSNNKPFGTATAFGGGSSFGSSTPFGQSTTAFGAKPATSNVFGQSTFGVSTPNTGGLFGNTSQPAGSGLFGQPSNTFGVLPASTSTGSFGFGTTQTSGGLFGNTAQTSTQSSGGLFGGSTSAFGQPRPAFGGFGTNTSGTGLFGQSTSTGTSLFGSSGFTPTVQSGTTVKFNPPTGTDTMMKGGVSTGISTRHQCITCMKEYENKSLEELRFEDYAANRKGGGAGAIGAFGSTSQQTGLFGSTPAASSSGFSFGNTTQSKPLFGTTGTTNAFGSGSIFGQPAQNQNTGLFGKSVGFGATTTASPVFNFGGPSAIGSGTSLFGQNNQQKPLFGQTTTSTGLFGSTPTTQSTGFGTTSTFGAFGATNQPSTGLFGAKPTGFGTTSTTTANSFSFNTNNMSGGGLFGQKQAAPAFGTSTGFGTQAPAFGSFGSTSTAGTGLFGQNKPATSVFGGTGSTFGTGLGNTFGSSTFPSMGGLGTNTGTGLFGNTNANKAPGFNFGSMSTGFNFGPTTNTSAFSFNPSSSLMSGSDPNNAAALQQAQQQIIAMTANPFGDSPLFRNPLKDTSRESEVLKPTNPNAQKALLNDNQLKVSLLPTAKIKPKPWSPSPNGKNFLFDGLEDEEPGLGSVGFLPKRSVKKLVLKNLGTNRSTFTLTSDISGASNQSTRIDVSISLNKSSKSHKVIKDTSPNAVPLTVDISDTSLKNTSTSAVKGLDTSRSPTEESINSPDAGIGRNNSLDDSIAALHTKGLGLRRMYNVSSDTEENPDRDLSSEVNCNSNISDEDSVQVVSTDKSGIILTKLDYYTIPPLNQLASFVDESGDCFVEDFVVGREDYGSVTFPGKINIAGLNLDEIVHFHKKEIDVYPDDSKKPPVGEELNREAIVTLNKCWPTDKTNHTFIQDPERLDKMGYREKLEKLASRLGAKFIDYIPESGSWTFKVEHFSKYGLVDDSDEEMDVSKPPENDKALAPVKTVEMNGQAHASLPQKQLKRKPISTLASEDDDMGDLPFHMGNQQEFLFPGENDFTNEVYSPTRPFLANHIHIDAERIQGMKASFFQQEMDDDNWSGASLHPQLENCFSIQKESDSLPFAQNLSSSKLDISVSSLSKKQRYSVYENDQIYLSSAPPVKLMDTGIQSSMSSLSLSAKQNEWLVSFPLVKSIPQQPPVVDKQGHILNKISLKPLEKSVMCNKHHLLADAGYFMGRSFRAGWRSDGTVTAVQPPSETDFFRENLPKFLLFGDNISFARKTNKNNGFILALKGVKIDTFYESEKQIQKNLIEALQLQLENSISTIENESPLFVPKPGVELIHSHAKLFESHLKDSDLDADTSFSKQCANVWNLLVSLWGKVRGINEDEDVSSYAVQMARREALSSWLVKSIEGTVTKAIVNLNQDRYLCKIFQYLSCRRIADAVKLAQQHQDIRLSLLLAQAEGTGIVRKYICNQLLNWEQNGAYKYIKQERIMLYVVLGGLLLWENVYETVNCCKDLDWKQTLALHLWYHCEPNMSIQVAVEEYDKSFQGEKIYSLPPYPSYINSGVDQMLDDSEKKDSDIIYDTCYHLLKLYCDRAHRLDQLLMPQTYTADNLDYRLSWLLHLALSSIGFNISVDLSSTLHMNFASELESINLWHWAVFVFLHHPDTEWRKKNVKDILLRHVSLEMSEENEEKEKFLKECLLVPEKWIFESKAIKAHSMGKHAEEAWFLLKAESWNKSHSIVVKHLASDAVINEDFDYLKKYLCELALPERSCSILDWSSGGQVYLDYINMNEMVKGVLGREISAYELEKITPEVLSLCDRLSSIPTPTIKDRVCVAEMAKRTATIMRSIAVLHMERSKNNTSLIMLASYFKNLPMPHDYAVTENRLIAHEFLKEVTSDYQVTY